VLFTVYFHAKLCLATIKIKDVLLYRVLKSEFEPCILFMKKPTKSFLGIG
jgi:hypothetical protein